VIVRGLKAEGGRAKNFSTSSRAEEKTKKKKVMKQTNINIKKLY